MALPGSAAGVVALRSRTEPERPRQGRRRSCAPRPNASPRPTPSHAFGSNAQTNGKTQVKVPRRRDDEPETLRGIETMTKNQQLSKLVEGSQSYTQEAHPLNILNQSKDPWALGAAVILSAHCTDAAVNKVMDPLLARFPTAKSITGARRDEHRSAAAGHIPQRQQGGLPGQLGRVPP